MAEILPHHLVDRFAGAGLALRIADSPLLQIGDPGIFQMDIEKARGVRAPLEGFRIWPGASQNRVLVLDTDCDLRQLTLLVAEPRRRYERTVVRSRYGVDVRGAERVVEDDGVHVRVEGWVDPSTRRYLCGFDERHLFIARYPWGSTVRDAHRALDPASGGPHAASRPERVLRQGEWFFVPATAEEDSAVQGYARDFPARLKHRAALASGRRPHVVDELVRVEPLKGGAPVGPITQATRFARGRVRHVEHASLELDSWHKVLLNLEPPETQGSGHPRRSLWVD